jgi:hypothetical protein
VRNKKKKKKKVRNKEKQEEDILRLVPFLCLGFLFFFGTEREEVWLVWLLLLRSFFLFFFSRLGKFSKKSQGLAEGGTL